VGPTDRGGVPPAADTAHGDEVEEFMAHGHIRRLRPSVADRHGVGGLRRILALCEHLFDSRVCGSERASEAGPGCREQI
jgi:hypothetical protein